MARISLLFCFVYFIETCRIFFSRPQHLSQNFPFKFFEYPQNFVANQLKKFFYNFFSRKKLSKKLLPFCKCYSDAKILLFTNDSLGRLNCTFKVRVTAQHGGSVYATNPGIRGSNLAAPESHFNYEIVGHPCTVSQQSK